MGIASDLVLIIIAALLGGLLAHLLRQPLLFGYMLAGIAVGPHTGGITVQNTHDIEMLAEIGVALLLFTLGLEFSLGELRRVWRIALLTTPLQILVCGVAGYLISRFVGLSASDSIWIGAAISLSSTMIVLKTLSSRDALESGSGRVMLAILIAQDVALIPIMLLIPQITSDAISLSPVAAAIGKSLLFIAVMYVTGVYALPRLFHFISRQGSRELLFLSTLTIALGAGYFAHEMGLSFALGTFIAGMLLSETEFSHQALSDVSTLRDLFALIFFVSVGMLFDPRFFFDHFSTIALLTLAVITCKSLMIAGTLRIFRYNLFFSATVGLGLAQVGEFAFLIAKTGSLSSTLSTESFSLIIAITLLSMVATPTLFWLGDRLWNAQSDTLFQSSMPVVSTESPLTLSEHVIIIGGGVVGQYVAQVLRSVRIQYIVVENDYKTVLSMRDSAIRVLFGDASHPVILEAAGLAQARLVVITTTQDELLPQMVDEIKKTRADVPIVVRVEEVEDISTLSSLSVTEIVQPQLEVGLEMVRQSLLSLRIDEETVSSHLSQLRAERYKATECALHNS
jgi:CPA2 family monovalent cation:H+ antiporter-2